MKTLFFISIISTHLAFAEQAKSGAVLECTPTVDLGVVPGSSQSLAAQFSLSNSGDKELWFSSLRTDCGCTTAVFTPETIAPGESGTLDIEIDPKGFVGMIKKSIYFSCNDKSNPVRRLTVKMFVPSLIAEPAQISIGQIAHDSFHKRTILLRNVGDLHTEILSISSSTPRVLSFRPKQSVTFPFILGEDENFLLDLSIDAKSSEPGMHNESITIAYKQNDKVKERRIDVTYLAKASLKVEPTNIYIPYSSKTRARKANRACLIYSDNNQEKLSIFGGQVQ